MRRNPGGSILFCHGFFLDCLLHHVLKKSIMFSNIWSLTGIFSGGSLCIPSFLLLSHLIYPSTCDNFAEDVCHDILGRAKITGSSKLPAKPAQQLLPHPCYRIINLDIRGGLLAVILSEPSRSAHTGETYDQNNDFKH